MIGGVTRCREGISDECEVEGSEGVDPDHARRETVEIFCLVNQVKGTNS